MLMTPGDITSLKVIDFGVSKVMETKRQTMHDLVGSALYVCPEMLQADANKRKRGYTPKCDVGVALRVVQATVGGAHFVLCPSSSFYGHSTGVVAWRHCVHFAVRGTAVYGAGQRRDV